MLNTLSIVDVCFHFHAFYWKWATLWFFVWNGTEFKTTSENESSIFFCFYLCIKFELFSKKKYKNLSHSLCSICWYIVLIVLRHRTHHTMHFFLSLCLKFGFSLFHLKIGAHKHMFLVLYATFVHRLHQMRFMRIDSQWQRTDLRICTKLSINKQVSEIFSTKEDTFPPKCYWLWFYLINEKNGKKQNGTN